MTTTLNNIAVNGLTMQKVFHAEKQVIVEIPRHLHVIFNSDELKYIESGITYNKTLRLNKVSSDVYDMLAERCHLPKTFGNELNIDYFIKSAKLTEGTTYEAMSDKAYELIYYHMFEDNKQSGIKFTDVIDSLQQNLGYYEEKSYHEIATTYIYGNKELFVDEIKGLNPLNIGEHVESTLNEKGSIDGTECLATYKVVSKDYALLFSSYTMHKRYLTPDSNYTDLS